MQTKYDLVNRVVRGRLRTELVKRRERGDSFQAIAFWLRSIHGIEVSHETVRQWYLRNQDDTAA